MTGFAGIRDLAERYRQGTLSPVTVVETALEQIALWEPHLNAFADPMREAALAEANRAARDLASGRDRGVLHGIPVAIKDLIDVQGTPTGFGTKVVEPERAARDARLVGRLRRAGAVILGKTNLLEYAYGVAHPEIGQTCNPHDPKRTAGGSSGGSAAAVAAGIVPLAVGTDTGGSIRIPAAYCGIVGLKPSFGRVPLDGVFPLSPSLDHAGPLARNVADAAVALGFLSGGPVPLAPPPLRRIRIGLLTAHFSGSEVGGAVSTLVRDVALRLRALGAPLREMMIPGLQEANGHLMTILLPEAAEIHAALADRNPGGYAPGTLAQIMAGREVKALDYLAAKAAQARLRRSVEAAFEGVDVLLSPAVPFVAPFEDPPIVDGPDSEMAASGFANVTGHPSIVLPCGMIDGLPVGLQLTGKAGWDAGLLSAAVTVETVLGSVVPQPVLA